MLFYVRLAQPYFPRYGKGGIGAAGKNAYVVTKGDANSAICGDIEWRGRVRHDDETVTCGAKGILLFTLSMLSDKPLIIRFTPDRIYIFDVATLRGGYYLRD